MANIPMSSASRPILLADDNRSDADLFGRALRRLGFQNPFHVVHSGEEVINYLRGEGQYANRAKFPMPQLLLLDSNMCGMSGLEVLQWVRLRREFSALPVIIFGGSGNTAEEAAAYRLGAAAYHRKPALAEEFDRVVKRIAELWLLAGDGL